MPQKLLPKRIYPLLTAIVVDDVGNTKHGRTAKQEIADHKVNFTGHCKPVPLNIYLPDSAYPGSFKPGTDLVIYDYGCMVPASSYTPCGNARHLIEWAQDHSSCLIVVVSVMTFTNFVEPEMRELGLLALDNITFFRHGGDPIPDWFKNLHSIQGRQGR